MGKANMIKRLQVDHILKSRDILQLLKRADQEYLLSKEGQRRFVLNHR